MRLYGLILGGVMAVAATGHVGAAQVSEGLILHLDAAAQIEAGGKGATNSVWKNLAGQPDSVAGSAVLKHFRSDSASGWTGSGTQGDPYALRFDGQTAYGVGPGSLELSEMTIETWAQVTGVGGGAQRGATLFGTDFGSGGIGVLVAATGGPILLNGSTFTPLGGEVNVGPWHQVVVTVKGNTARLYVDGEFQSSTEIDRRLQTDHYPGYNLGAARHSDNDFVEADGLVGSLAILRVYNRAISAKGVLTNFEADKGRFPVSQSQRNHEPVTSMPIPSVPGLGDAPPVRCMKWDYYHNPVGAMGGWPYGQRFAFDGYPTNVTQPYTRNYWRTDVPAPGKPAAVTIDYKRPVAVTRYVHYYDRSRNGSAWKDVEILATDDGENWSSVQSYKGLDADYPQVLGIDSPRLARYYKIIVHSLADGAPVLASHEIETYYGATIGSVTTPAVIQSEAGALTVRVVSPDADVHGGVLRLIAPKGCMQGETEVALPSVTRGGSSTASFNLTALRSGQIPVMVEVHVGKFLIDKRPYVLRVSPKLAISDVTPVGAVIARSGDEAVVKGVVTNSGAAPASGVKVTWMGRSRSLGDLAPGESAGFELRAKAVAGYVQGALTATADGLAKTVLNRPLICSSSDAFSASTPAATSAWTISGGAARVSIRPSGAKSAVTSELQLLVGGKAVTLTSVGKSASGGTLAAAIPGGVLLVDSGASSMTGGDLGLKCRVVPNDPQALDIPWSDFEIRLAVDDPKVMFRPHIDWYTVEHGPNYPGLANGHNSATRMLCVQTPNSTLSMVPDTDNFTWGFTPDNKMTISFQVPMADYDLLGQGIWKPIYESPREFTLTLPVREGGWWDAYRHVVSDIFKFEEPRQWAMPITQMQMLTSRYLMRSEVWSERWQTVRSHVNFDFFYNFYGVTYTLPALYSWYLVTDDQTARVKAEKVADWLLNMQEKSGPAAGAWFSMYCVEGSPKELVGRDQAFNRWVLPHATGTSAKTLLWYWAASGKKDSRAFEAARRGCDWLLSTQRPDGGWPYALDLTGKPITDLGDAGLIWCTWALWRMWEYTGDTKYKDAALKSKDYFKRDFVDLHRYMGYWEDVSGAAGQVARSWEGYEPAIAAMVCSEMGDKDLAIECARDAATWSWTRVTSTRQYETAYGETTEQSLCGPSQAQSPMVAIGLHEAYELTGDNLYRDFSGSIKAVNFCADPDYAYGMVATGGWDDPTTGVIGPPYENVRPIVTPNDSRGDEYGRQIWNSWCTDQFAWYALEWLVREANVRAPQYFAVDKDTFKGTVLGAPGRVKMPEEKCDVNGIEHYDINWVGYQNDLKYALLVMNHKEKLTVAIRPHEAHLDVYTREPRILVGSGKDFCEVKVVKRGVQYMVDIPAGANAVLVWDRIK